MNEIQEFLNRWMAIAQLVELVTGDEEE